MFNLGEILMKKSTVYKFEAIPDAQNQQITRRFCPFSGYAGYVGRYYCTLSSEMK